jgi:hypothetical protein
MRILYLHAHTHSHLGVVSSSDYMSSNGGMINELVVDRMYRRPSLDYGVKGKR